VRGDDDVREREQAREHVVLEHRINLGLGAMVLLSVLPVGLLQTWADVEQGYWYARSAEFLQSPVMNTLRWLRVIGDTVFAIGAITFVIVIGPARDGAVTAATSRTAVASARLREIAS
jgi:nitric oxide reductase large subunit